MESVCYRIEDSLFSDSISAIENHSFRSRINPSYIPEIPESRYYIRSLKRAISAWYISINPGVIFKVIYNDTNFKNIILKSFNSLNQNGKNYQ